MDKHQIKRLAKLVRIKIDDKEMPAIAEDLSRIVEYVSKIQNAATHGEQEPKAGMLRNILRQDTNPHESGIYSESILENLPDREGDYVKVKKIL